MTGFALSLLVASSLVAEVRSYPEAHAAAQKSGKPILVLVGADWCPGCRTLKFQTMPRLDRSGKLNQVEFAQVDTDREDALSDRLMRGSTIPQLILYTRTATGWSRKQLTGAQADQTIESFVKQGLESHVGQASSLSPAATTPATATPSATPAQPASANGQ